jgi:hypothetical protein
MDAMIVKVAMTVVVLIVVLWVMKQVRGDPKAVE